MDRPQLMAIVIGILVLLLVLMYTGWRARKRRQRTVAAPHPAPAELGPDLGTFTGKYVATTASGKPFERIAVHGLGFRSSAALTVAGEGLLVRRPGADDVWIPKAELRSRRQATWTIDRVVEPGGLELVEWELGDTTVDSYFRLNEPRAFEDALDTLIGTAA